MKIIKRVSVLSILVIISFLFVGCDNRDEGMSDFKTYSNTHYTFHYPSNWPEPAATGFGPLLWSGNRPDPG